MFASGTKPAAGGGGGFDSYSKATFFSAGSINNETWTKLPFAAVVYDNLNEVDTVTNKRWTATEDGIYKITLVASVKNLAITAGIGCSVRIYKNGATPYERSPAGVNIGAILDAYAPAMQVTTLELNAGDYIEGYVWHNGGAAKLIEGQNNYCTFERIA